MKTSELLEVLDSAINAHVSPFMAAQGARHTTGLSNFDGYPGPSSITLRQHSKVGDGIFWWVNRFETGRTTFDIGYGDREALIETMLYYEGIRDRFAPWELLEAARVPDKLTVTGEMWVHKPDFMKQVIARIGEGLTQHWGILSSPSEEIIDRALVLRGKRMIFAQEEQRRRDRERSCVKASIAFHAGNPTEAIRLLEPFEHDTELSRSSKMMLDLARRKS
jgi:hypothetical protein